MDVQLRPGTWDDLDWLLELRATVLKSDLDRLGVFDPHRVRQRLRDAYDPAHTRIIVADEQNIGCIAVRPTDDARWIEHFYIDPRCQGQQIGSRVLAAVVAEADPRPLRLNVLRGSAAQRLYERFDFTVDSEDAVDVYMVRRSKQ